MYKGLNWFKYRFVLIDKTIFIRMIWYKDKIQIWQNTTIIFDIFLLLRVVFCHICFVSFCIMSYFYFVFFVFCHFCVLSFCVLSYLYFVLLHFVTFVICLFAFCHICIWSFCILSHFYFDFLCFVIFCLSNTGLYIVIFVFFFFLC